MVDQVEYLWSLILHLFQALRKSISMSLWRTVSAHKRSKESSDRKVNPILEPLSGSRDVDSKFDIVSDGACVRLENFENKLPVLGQVASAIGEVKTSSSKMKKRPARIAIPESCGGMGFGEAGMEIKDSVATEYMEVEGSEYCLASRKGSRHVMEDGYGVITNIHGDSKQAFFGVFDGHGGRAAVDFVSEKLGNNIINAISQMEEESQLELAIKEGYLTTDRDFLSQGVSSGACASTVLLRNGELHVSNVGDCRVVMSKKGVATALTCDHRAGRKDERIRIERSGGYVTCRNGLWRVHDSLAVSRAIGDVNMKELIISEPETEKLRLTPDCEFLIIASDGLWDKVTNQEAADVVSRHGSSMKSCRDLVEMSSRRGSRDDITVMVVDLQRFV